MAGHEFTSGRGYLDLWAGDPDPDVRRTIESFGFEWTTFDAVNEEDEGFWHRYFADVPLEELRGRIGLDAGCGKGRYSRLTAPHLSELVAMDASLAVEAAVRNTSDLKNATVIRGDLRKPPLRAETFGFVSCLGVLHHLADPLEGFRSLVRLLAPGGLLLIYVYSRPQKRGVRSYGLSAAAVMRKVTTRVPVRALRALCLPLSVALYVAFVLPGVAGNRWRIRTLARLPLGIYRGQPLRSLWLDTFDRLSAPLEFRYSWSDLEGWYRDAGLDVRAIREDAGLYILAEKPAPQSATAH